MASTYSALKIELIATGEQSGTWGTTTNNNLGNDALGEAITGSADVAFSSADVTVTLTDTNASQAARNLRLNLTGTSGGARQLILGSGCQIEKLYLINNGLADAVTVKNTSGSGIAVPAGKTMFVYNNGTNVVDAVTHASSLTLGSALPVTSGGTGSTSTTFVNLASNVTGTLPVANGGTGQTTLQNAMDALAGAVTSGQYLRGNGADVVMSAIQAGDVPTLNQNTSGTAGGLSATLAVSSGGTGVSTLTSANVILGAGTSAVTFVAPGSNGNVLTSNGSTWTSAAPPAGGVTSLNGQTGAITNTSQYAIGSYVNGRPQNGTAYAVNSTLAGSSIYATSTSLQYEYAANQWRTFTNGTSLSGGTTLVNTGTWRCMAPAGISPGDQVGIPGLWVRIS